MVVFLVTRTHAGGNRWKDRRDCGNPPGHPRAPAPLFSPPWFLYHLRFVFHVLLFPSPERVIHGAYTGHLHGTSLPISSLGASHAVIIL